MAEDSRISGSRIVPWYTRDGFRKRRKLIQETDANKGIDRSDAFYFLDTLAQLYATIYETRDLLFEVKRESKYSLSFLKKVEYVSAKGYSPLVAATCICPFGLVLLLGFHVLLAISVLAVLPAAAVFLSKMHSTVETKEQLNSLNSQFEVDIETLVTNVVDVSKTRIFSTLELRETEQHLNIEGSIDQIEKSAKGVSAVQRWQKLLESGVLPGLGDVLVRFSDQLSVKVLCPQGETSSSKNDIEFSNAWSSANASTTQYEKVDANRDTVEPDSEPSSDGKISPSQPKGSAGNFPNQDDPAITPAGFRADGSVDDVTLGSDGPFSIESGQFALHQPELGGLPRGRRF